MKLKKSNVKSGIHKLAVPKQVDEKLRLSPAAHQLLVDHVRNLIASNSEDRSKRIRMMSSIEIDLMGVAEPVGGDCDRAQKRNEGRGAALQDRIYPFGYFLIRRYASDLSAMVMPYEAPYQVATAKTDQSKANQISRSLRHMAAVFDHRNHVNACIYDALVFDYFGHEVRDASVGTTQTSVTGASDVNEAGFEVLHLDPYNIMHDTSVFEHEVAQRGEFIAVCSQLNMFQARLMAQEKEIYLESKAVREHIESLQTQRGSATAMGTATSTFYADVELNRARYAADHRKQGDIQNDFTGMFTMQATDKHYNPNSLEMIRMQIRLDPTEYGLLAGASTGIKLYEIKMIEDVIVYAKPLVESQGMFTMRVGTMSYDRQLGRHVAMGDAVADLSSYASNMLNTHKRAMRKGLEGGVTIYNPDVIPLEKLDDMSGGRVATRALRFDQDIRKHVMQLNDPVDTKNSLRDIDSIMGLMGGLVPQSSRPEMAGLDRATEFQAQAVAMTGDRAMLLDGALIDGQLVSPIRAALQHKLMHSDLELVYIDEDSKQALGSMTADDRKRLKYRIIQPAIFMGIDRLRTSNLLSQITNMTLQVGDQISPLAAMLIEHLMSTSGSPLDMEEYKKAIQETQERQAQQLAQENGDPNEQPTAQPGPAIN